MSELFKIITRSDKTGFNTMFKFNRNTTRGHKFKLQKSRVRTLQRKHFFTHTKPYGSCFLGCLATLSSSTISNQLQQTSSKGEAEDFDKNGGSGVSPPQATKRPPAADKPRKKKSSKGSLEDGGSTSGSTTGKELLRR